MQSMEYGYQTAMDQRLHLRPATLKEQLTQDPKAGTLPSSPSSINIDNDDSVRPDSFRPLTQTVSGVSGVSDFKQNGYVATLHNLTHRPVEELEHELQVFSSTRPMTLILPSLFSELEGPALSHIIDELSQVKYLREIIIGLDRADRSQFEHAKSYFSRLPQKHSILWNDGPRLRELDKELADSGLSPQEPGKGRNVWYCMGYALASRNADVVGLHDCDIVTYDRGLLARLFYPVANPAFSYVFAKGYYARIGNRKLNGRVMRLLVTPLLLTMEKVFGPKPYLDYLKAFRYPLAGEFAMRMGVVSDVRIPSDWGLEIGILSEVYRNYSARSICQVQIAGAYDHKHQDVSDENPDAGLSKMSTDIAKSLFRKLATDGQVFSAEGFRSLKATYLRLALDMVEMYQNDAIMNGLDYDRHREEKSVELFANNILQAGQTFLETPFEVPYIPAWNRVHAAIPDFVSRLHDAVQKDSE
jgi:glucosyl-3-phosphoglycerate synthase